jgi:hypothetical protein
MKLANFGENGHGQTDVFSRHLSGMTQENHEKPQSGYVVPRPIFEPSISRVRSKNVATWTLLTQQLDNRWTEIHEIWYRRRLLKYLVFAEVSDENAASPLKIEAGNSY